MWLVTSLTGLDSVVFLHKKSNPIKSGGLFRTPFVKSVNYSILLVPILPVNFQIHLEHFINHSQVTVPNSKEKKFYAKGTCQRS